MEMMPGVREALESAAFYEIAALLALASLLGLIGIALRQPLIVSFIAVGVLAGPSVFGIVELSTHIDLLAQLGVSILLFLVGLQLDLKLIRTVGAVAAFTGLGQVAFTSVIGFGLCLLLGMEPLESFYVAVALTFSSTIIIVKLLSDKRELDSLHGRIALGFLIVQDLVVVVAMIVLSAAGIGRSEERLAAELATAIGMGAALVLGIGLFIRFVADALTRVLIRAPELLVCFAIGWAALLAAAADLAGLSLELGGLLAGVSLASTPYREAIASRLLSVRDFMLLFFFVALGARLDLDVIGGELWAAVALALFVLIGNPLIVMVIMAAMGYRRRTGFLAGLTVAQISEFSLVFVAMGLTLGHVGVGAVGLVTLVGLITIALSTYMILYSAPLYRVLEPALWPFERRVPYREPEDAPRISARFDVVLFGLGRYGGAIARGLRQRGLEVLGVDFDPEIVRRRRQQGFDAIYGDVHDPDFLRALPFGDASWVVSAIHAPYEGPLGHDHRVALLKNLRGHGFRGRIGLTAHNARDAVRLKQAGADLVLMPFVDAARHAAEEIAMELPAIPPVAAGPAGISPQHRPDGPCILLAHDLSRRCDTALIRALDLAARRGAHLTVLHVVPGEPPPDPADDASRDAEAWLRRQIQSAGGGRIARIVVRRGEIASVVSQLAEETAVELIVIGAPRSRIMADVGAGTTVERLLRNGRTPLLVARRPAGQDYRRLLVATDLSDGAAEALRCAARLFPDAEMRLIHVADLPVPDRALDVQKMARGAARRPESATLEREVAAWAAAAGCPEPAAIRIVFGAAAERLAESALVEGSDLMVVGTSGRSGVMRTVLGSVAAQAIRTVPLDILAVPPP